MIITARDENEIEGDGHVSGLDVGDAPAIVLPCELGPSFEALARAIKAQRSDSRAAPTLPAMPAPISSEPRCAPTLPAMPAPISMSAVPTDFIGDRPTPVTHGFMPGQPGRYRCVAPTVRVVVAPRGRSFEGEESSSRSHGRRTRAR